MKNYLLDLIHHNRKRFFLFVFLVTLILILLWIKSFQKEQPAPSEPPVIQRVSPPPISTFYNLPSDYQKILQDDLKDLHWLSNSEIAYTFFDLTFGQRVLAKTNLINGAQVFLIKDVAIKLSEVYWSRINNLIIFDYGTPYTTYQYDYTGNKLSKTILNGYGYSWSPEGSSLFFFDLNDNLPKIYNLEANSFRTINIENFPPFQLSFWSSNSSKILLYDIDPETGRAQVNILDLSNNSINRTSLNNLLFPSLSPLGDKFAYVSDGGIYASTNNQEPILAYQTSTDPQFISFAWVNDDELIIFDGGKTEDQFIFFSLLSNTSRIILKDIKVQTDQRARFEFSPDNNNLALALDKDGLWIIKKSYINQ